jgi:hypothetical protein
MREQDILDRINRLDAKLADSSNVAIPERAAIVVESMRETVALLKQLLPAKVAAGELLRAFDLSRASKSQAVQAFGAVLAQRAVGLLKGDTVDVLTQEDADTIVREWDAAPGPDGVH